MLCHAIAAIYTDFSTSIPSTKYFGRDGIFRVRGGPGQKKEAGDCEIFRNTSTYSALAHKNGPGFTSCAGQEWRLRTTSYKGRG